MSESEPWILFHAPWKSRAKSGLVVLEQIERFIATVAVDPAPQWADLMIHEDHGDAMASRTRELPGTPENEAGALAAIDYRPAPLIEDAQRRFGPGQHLNWTSGSTGFRFKWEWRRTAAVEIASFIEFYRTHEALPEIGGMTQVDVTLNYDFEVKRPGTVTPLFPDTALRSTVMVWLGARSVNVTVRYAASEFTPELRQIHTEVVAALGPKPPRRTLQQIFPAKREGGRQRRVRLD